MPNVKIEKATKLNFNDAFDQVQRLLETDKDLRKMDPSCQFHFDRPAGTGRAKGSMFSADLKVVSAPHGTTVTIEVSLPIMLSMAKGVIQQTLERKLNETLGTG